MSITCMDGVGRLIYADMFLDADVVAPELMTQVSPSGAAKNVLSYRPNFFGCHGCKGQHPSTGCRHRRGSLCGDSGRGRHVCCSTSAGTATQRVPPRHRSRSAIAPKPVASGCDAARGEASQQARAAAPENLRANAALRGAAAAAMAARPPGAIRVIWARYPRSQNAVASLA